MHLCGIASIDVPLTSYMIIERPRVYILTVHTRAGTNYIGHTQFSLLQNTLTRDEDSSEIFISKIAKHVINNEKMTAEIVVKKLNLPSA